MTKRKLVYPKDFIIDYAHEFKTFDWQALAYIMFAPIYYFAVFPVVWAWRKLSRRR